MKVICGMAIASGVLALGAAAQEIPLQTNVQMDKMKMELEQLTAEARVMSIGGGVMGPAVKGAPYSADEVRESTQVLADGTTIHNENKTTVYRDGEGRVRRETPNEISIWDPSSGTNYVLNPKTMTARKMGLNYVFTRSLAGPGSGGETKTFSFSYNTNKSPEPPFVVMSDEHGAAVAGSASAAAGAVSTGVATANGPGQAMMKVERRQRGKVDSLGTQTMEGVKADGERVTSTIEAGAIGNDRPIQTTTERWYSPELQTNIMTKRSDPRMGDEVFKLTNIHRGEPSPVLFEVPPGYTIVNQK
jgi:hypothetical protein